MLLSKPKNVLPLFLILLLLASCGTDEEMDPDANPNPDGNGLLVETLPITSSSYNGDDGLSIDSKGSIYVSNLASGIGTQIHKITLDGNTVSFATNLPGPMGHAFDATDNLFVAFRNSNTIVQIDPQGASTDYITDNRFKGGSLVIDDDGTIFHTVFSTNAVYKISPQKVITQLAIGGHLNVPFGITLDDNKNIYVANFSNGAISKITSDGEISLLATIGSRVGYLIHSAGKLYATGFSSHNIYVVELDGSFSVLIGTGVSGNSDGRGDEASLASPNGIGVSPDGKTLYVSQKNFKIRKITL